MKKPDFYRLRKMKSADLETVLKWRNSDRIRSVMFTDNVITMEEHIDWLKRVKGYKNMTSLIFEYNGVPVGVINFSGINKISRQCSWGFYLDEENLKIVRPGYGLPPKYYEMLLGKILNQNAKKGTPLSWELIAKN